MPEILLLPVNSLPLIFSPGVPLVRIELIDHYIIPRVISTPSTSSDGVLNVSRSVRLFHFQICFLGPLDLICHQSGSLETDSETDLHTVFEKCYKEKGNSTGQKEKLNWNAIATETLADPMRCYGIEMTLQNCPILRKTSQTFIFPYLPVVKRGLLSERGLG